MTVDTVKELIVTALLVLSIWRIMRLEVNLAKIQMELEHQIDLLRVYKEDKK